MNNIPTVDLGAFLNGTDQERQKIAANVDQICRNIGFLIIENHGVPKDIIDGAWQAAEQFFAQTDEEKRSAQPSDAGCPRGYYPLEGESLAKTIGEDAPPDSKETFSSGPLAPPDGQSTGENFDFFYGANIWPSQPDNFRANWETYYKEVGKFGANLMKMLAVALGVDEDYFKKYHTHHISALRSQNYPATTTPLKPGQLRAGAHNDYGSVTILKADPNVGGLEVKSPEGNWIAAPKVDDAYIINIGDLLARWTNDRWVSTLHRVVEPDGTPDGPSPKRQSIAYFMNPNYDAEIIAIPTCVADGEMAKYAPVLAGDYLIEKFTQST